MTMMSWTRVASFTSIDLHLSLAALARRTGLVLRGSTLNQIAHCRRRRGCAGHGAGQWGAARFVNRGHGHECNLYGTGLSRDERAFARPTGLGSHRSDGDGESGRVAPDSHRKSNKALRGVWNVEGGGGSGGGRSRVGVGAGRKGMGVGARRNIRLSACLALVERMRKRLRGGYAHGRPDRHQLWLHPHITSFSHLSRESSHESTLHTAPGSRLQQLQVAAVPRTSYKRASTACSVHKRDRIRVCPVWRSRISASRTQPAACGHAT